MFSARGANSQRALSILASYEFNMEWRKNILSIIVKKTIFLDINYSITAFIKSVVQVKGGSGPFSEVQS